MAPNTVRQPSPSTGIAIMYITVGVLMTIWAAVWYYFLNHREEVAYDWKYFVCIGLLLSGVSIAVIGLLVGRIGREAQHADIPVGQVTSATVQPTNTDGQPLPAQPLAAAQPAVAVQPAVAAQPVAPANGPMPARTIPTSGS